MDEKIDPRLAWTIDQIQKVFKNVKYEKLKNSEQFIRCILDYFNSKSVKIENKKIDHLFQCIRDRFYNTIFKWFSEQLQRIDASYTKIRSSRDKNREYKHKEIIENGYFPLLSSPQNQENWTDIAIKEVNTLINTFLSDIQIMEGKMEGHTYLPIPPDLTNLTSPDQIKERLHLFESSIITWTKQIKDVIVLDPEANARKDTYLGPMSEIDYWNEKSNDLNSIYNQLQGEKIRKVLTFLDMSKSTYNASFAKLCKEVLKSREESVDNMKYLSPLKVWFSKLSSINDFESIDKLFKPIFHIIHLIWKLSTYYNTQNRIMVLIRKICNEIINQACKYLTIQQLFSLIDSEDYSIAHKTIQNCITICGSFKSIYFDYKTKINTDCPDNQWKMPNNFIFLRLDLFLERCHDILMLEETIHQFSSLSKIEVGGTKGKTLTTSVVQIHSDFLQEVDILKNSKYDLMDISKTEFDDDFYTFKTKVRELEKRLSSVISQGYDDCSTIASRFKILLSFEGLLSRQIIYDEIERKQLDLLKSYGNDIQQVLDIFQRNKDKPYLSQNIPPIAGAILWCRSLKTRLNYPMEQFKQLNKLLLEREEAREILKDYMLLINNISEYESNLLLQWSQNIEENTIEKLKLPLLRMDKETNYMIVNFDPSIVRLLREIKYLLSIKIEIPESTTNIYKKVEIFRQQTGNLELIVNMYNKILREILPIEKPLISSHLQKMERTLLPGTSSFTWKGHGIDPFIIECMNVVKEGDQIFRTLRNNMQEIVQILETWKLEPLMSRDPKPQQIKAFQQDYIKYISVKYEMIKEGGKNIHNLIKDTNRKLKVSQGQTDWKNYVDYISNIIVDGLIQVIIISLRYLLNQIDRFNKEKTKGKAGYLPLLEITMDLIGRNATYIPHIGDVTSSDKGLKEYVISWVDSFFKISECMKRLDNSAESSYIKELQQDERITTLLSQINQTLDLLQGKCDAFMTNFTKYNFLWINSIDDVFEEFLDENITKNSKIKYTSGKINLDSFDEKLLYYHKLHDQIEDIPNSEDLSFLRVNTQPIKQSLNTYITKWLFTYSNYLQKILKDELLDYNKFIKKINAGLSEEIRTNDQQSLMDCMENIRDVKKNIDPINKLFEPLRNISSLLRKHQISIEDITIENYGLMDYLDQAPILWDNTVDITFKRKEIILPMQNQMASTIRRDVTYFKDKIGTFKNEFISKGPTSKEGFIFDMAYHSIDSYSDEILSLIEESKSLENLEEIFELEVSRYEDLKELLEDVKGLKTIWDMENLIESTYNSWMETLWSKIDTDELLMETKRFQSQLINLPKRINQWEIYKDLTNQIKNLIVTLPLINDLHSKSMKNRHWKNIMVVTKKKIDKGPDFSLNDVVKLNLYEHVDEIQEIIQISQKELKVNEKLKGIDEYWQNTEMKYGINANTKTNIIVLDTEIIDNLEDHQLQLQTMIGMGKYIEYFKNDILTWQKNLSDAESIIRQWLQVQNRWVALESIYLHSQDIQIKLPEDTIRFKSINNNYIELMESVKDKKLVLEICLKEGLLDSLLSLWRELEKCQKSLDEYLETKKDIFPRFYFVSNQSLLDILSNSDNPLLIQGYLGDCYNGIESLDILPPSEESNNFKVIAMKSKDNEKVEFKDEFIIEGPVELWLNSFTEFMQNSLKEKLKGSLEEAQLWKTEKPREQWLLDYPAQISLLGSQIMWSEETESALVDLENGSEDSLKVYLELCVKRLEILISLIQGELIENERTKIMTLITIDVHNRDIIQNLINKKVEGISNFSWQSQLRYYWDEQKLTCFVKIVDFRTEYSYEYLGNTGRLVITPLTDRCYITLSVAMKLTLGGAPAGPAGTGKTETTKDLARALGLGCYVFNCSDQMNYQTLGDIFKGLSQSGTWGCFDEFNRICIEVLSVIATQVKCILDAIRYLYFSKNRQEEYQNIPNGKPSNTIIGYFDFMGYKLRLMPTVGIFITMNPGYAGRTELPENIKALFRSCAMIRPDLIPICENMLMAEGFIKAKPMSIKFVTLYKLCSELLSKQIHYDWGLRAVKSVLRVAGILKRGDPGYDEELILMRALRDFNIPKIVTSDIPIFLRLIADLFPNMNISPNINETIKSNCIEAGKEANIITEDEFILKVVQLQELIDVRHSIFILGPTGSGKTTIWKNLVDCHNYKRRKAVCLYETVHPKAVTSDELYGYMNLSKDWSDGCLSIIMRNMSKNILPYTENQLYKYIVLDGDVDALWIESMNTVMDDNKVLTLVSNERIPLSNSMRMLFEVHTLKNASPATVSRAGILYINETDIGWKPKIDSWLNMRKELFDRNQAEKLIMFYVEEILLQMKVNKMEMIIHIPTISLIENLIRYLTILLDKFKPKNKNDFEMILTFSCMWAFGGSIIEDKGINYKKKFDDIYRSSFKTCLYPAEGLVYDYNIDKDDSNNLVFNLWSNYMSEYIQSADVQFQNIQIDTNITVSLTNFMNLFVNYEYPIMFIGQAGTGKTLMIKNYLKVNEENRNYLIINMNYYTDSKSLQKQLEDQIDKRSGKIYGPRSAQKLIYFIDDINMPFVEQYGTQTPLALLRQYFDYNNWFDRTDLSLRKHIVDIQFISAMNHKSGSFTINPRLQRHFTSFAVDIPDSNDFMKIYTSIFSTYVFKYSKKIQEIVPLIVKSTLELYQIISEKFLPTAIKFHYIFNLRDIRNIFQSLCITDIEHYNTPIPYIRLWIHECNRVFEDRLVSELEILKYQSYLVDVAKKYFDESPEILFQKPIIYTSFNSKSEQNLYLPIEPNEVEINNLYVVLKDKLNEYNEIYSIMELVLFDQAVEHITRICRILQYPQGNGLLIGVGGSGKQSLCKLSSYIMGIDIFQMTITTQTSTSEIKEILKDLYKKVGIKPATPLVFIVTDSQIYNEQFLIYINDMLSSGFIPDLFTKDEMETNFSSLRNLAKANGYSDTRNSLLDFFLNRVKQNLHVMLCFSPVGERFRSNCRKFPGIINCTVIDWFHPWSKEALVSVAQKFLKDMPIESEDIKDNLAVHMSEVHLSVQQMSEKYIQLTKRYNYVTPKSYLSLISLFNVLLLKKKEDYDSKTKRLLHGLNTLLQTSEMVIKLKEELQQALIRVEEKKVAANELLKDMGQKKSEAEKEQLKADKEKVIATESSKLAEELRSQASAVLAEAQPALDKAKEAVNCLDKNSLTELKSMTNPPSAVLQVTQCCLMMLRNEKKDFSWDNSKRMMNRVDLFKKELEMYDSENIPADVKQRLEPIIKSGDFTYKSMCKKSIAAANLVTWIINIINFNTMYILVKPKMDALRQAEESSKQAEIKLDKAQQVVTEMKSLLNNLQEKFMVATNEKAKVEAEATVCQNKLELAERLVNGLSSENQRWTIEVEKIQSEKSTLTGDCMLSSSFVSYLGTFNSKYRIELWKDIWIQDIENREIPLRENIDPQVYLTTESIIADYLNHGLPYDRISLENSSIILNTERWPLIIDPQLQAIKWIRNQEKQNDICVIRFSQPNWLKVLMKCVQEGTPLLIENVNEEINPVIEPLISKSYIKKKRTVLMNINGEEIEYDFKFRLYLQTKLSNPHYKPEIFAQCCIINFIVTEKGLEEQLLQLVVRKEQPELEEQKQQLQSQLNEYKIQLVKLEDYLLERIVNAPSDILSDLPLIEGLEATKKKSSEISAAVEKAIYTDNNINIARDQYRPVAIEGSLLYFISMQLSSLNHMYQYSLDSFLLFFFQSLEKSSASDDMAMRILNIKEMLRFIIYKWISRGLYEDHKLILLSLIVFQLLSKNIIGHDCGFSSDYLVFLLKSPKNVSEDNPIDWLPTSAWYSVSALSKFDLFSKFLSDLVDNSSRFREWYNLPNPEKEKLPLDWRELEKTPFLKLLIIRCLRPDRMIQAIIEFISQIFPHSEDFIECDLQLNSYLIMKESYLDSTPNVPLYFILSPGSDIVEQVDKLAKDYGKIKGNDYLYISLGQGQDALAMKTITIAHSQGYWVLLNNLHLMPKFLIELEKKLDEFALVDSHPGFRLFFASDSSDLIPIGLLNRCIKLTNESPSGLKSNLKRAFSTFNPEEFDTYDSRTRGIIFGLCYFHAILIERKTYGAKGFNLMYPFSNGDLRDSSIVLLNYMENAPTKIPWEDLRYIFGEIMYGGHIVNDFDRLLCNKYLEFYMKDSLLDEIELVPYADAEDSKYYTYRAPLPTFYEKYLNHIKSLTNESPIYLGLHPNTEIEFRTVKSNELFDSIQNMQTQNDYDMDSNYSKQNAIESLLSEILESYRDFSFDLNEILDVVPDPGPFQNVFIQEIELMNLLIREMKTSLIELEKGFAGELQISENMEKLSDDLYNDRLPIKWEMISWPSVRNLGSWLIDLQKRIDQLSELITNTLEVPKVTWISGFFSPQSFLTAIMQFNAHKTNLELDKLCISTEVQRKYTEEVDSPSRDGYYITGLYMEGARWDIGLGTIVKSLSKEMHCFMPVINCKTVEIKNMDINKIYSCPVYKTQQRGNTFVFTANLRTNEPYAKWVLGSVVLVMDVL